MRRCLRRNQPGPYQIQAAINAVHSDAPTAADTDWRQILQLYDQLLALAPSPVVALNRAVAVAEVDGPDAALALVDGLDLDGYHLFHAIRADLLRRLGRARRGGGGVRGGDRPDRERGRARLPADTQRQRQGLTGDIFAGFPGDLFVILVGVTYLFAIASNNGTVDWLVHAAVRGVRGHTAAIPWVMFLVTAILTASGAVVPGAVAIVAPIGLGFAVQYGINPVLMGLMIINGATAGGFSPISVFGSIVNGVVERNDLAENATLLFASSFLFNLVLSVIAFFLFGGRELLGRRVPVAEEERRRADAPLRARGRAQEARRAARRRSPAARRRAAAAAPDSTATRSSRSPASPC